MNSEVPLQVARERFLGGAHSRTLTLVCDTLFPPLKPPPGTALGSPEHAYWRRRASDLEVSTLIEDALANETSPGEQALFRLALHALENPAVCMLVTGSPTPFRKRDTGGRVAMLRALSASRVPQLRQLFQTFKRLACYMYFTAPPKGGQGLNPNAEALGYPDPWRPPSRGAAPANPDHPIRSLPITEDTQLDADVCIVGSGAGGGVIAALMASAGYRVVVLEAGDAWTEHPFQGEEGTGFEQLFAKRGLLATEDGRLLLLAGRTLGGGTTVNWMTCFRPPQWLLEQWAEESGLPELLGPELQASLDGVERRLHVNTDESQVNPNNAALLRGAAALGWHHARQARNAVGCGDCGHCTFGCQWGAKQDTVRTYLQDAYEAGARLVTRTTVERVLFEGSRAVGVEARVGPPGPLPLRARRADSTRLTVRAPIVVVAAGAIESPALLLRSRLRLPALGRNLFIHPATVVVGRFEEEIAAWSGVLQAAHSDQFADLDGRGHGFKFEATPIYPGLAATVLPWEHPRAFKEQMLRLKHAASLLVLVRDRVGGRVTLDRWGNPVIRYAPDPAVTSHLLRGCKEGGRLLIAAGALDAHTLHTRPVTIERPGTGAPDWQRFDADVARRGAGAHNLSLFSAHQMGTCRMGIHGASSVVDGRGKVHGVEGLYVADGSLFPLASGVNPMISIMGLAHWIGKRLAR